MAAIALVIFDCDGVLVDSEPLAHRVLVAMLAEHGVRMGFDEALSLFLGTSMARCLELVERLTGVPPARFLPAFRARTYAAFAAELQPVRGVAELLPALPIPYCVASNGPREKMAFTLGRTGLIDRFAGRMFSADDVARPKPAPDLFLYAAQRMGARPESCMVVEDSPSGIHAARAAAMVAIGYAALTPAERLLDAGAHAVIDALEQLPPLVRR